MCGRYGFTDPSKLRDRYDAENSSDVDLKPRYNIAPSQTLPVVIKNGVKHIELMRWGLIPFWAKDIRIGSKMINARAEGIQDKPSFRRPFKSQRCLVPANYFFEWRKTEDGSTPFLIKVQNEDIFSFAGLYDIVKDAEGKELKSYTIITTEPNRLMLKIHNRMPVVLKKEDEELWLSSDAKEEDLLDLLKPFPEEKMEAFEVSKSASNPDNDNSSVTNPV